MNKMIYAAIAAAGMLCAAGADATTLVLTATDAVSITNAGSHYGDNMLRAYTNGSFTVHGFMKFDLSSLPDTATISSIMVSAYHDAGYNSPNNSPTIAVDRVDDDSWSAASGNPALGPQVSGVVSSFSAANEAESDWTLDPSLLNLGANLADNTLSLALVNTNANYSYDYFFTNGSNTTPKLTIQYELSAPEPGAWVMMVAGFGLIGAALRQKRTGEAGMASI